MRLTPADKASEDDQFDLDFPILFSQILDLWPGKSPTFHIVLKRMALCPVFYANRFLLNCKADKLAKGSKVRPVAIFLRNMSLLLTFLVL